MALYVFDGTGQEDREGLERDSNACKFFNAYEDPDKNDDPDKPRGSLYLKGIGTRARTFTGRTFSEAFGIGGHRRVRQAMERLENNIDAGDDTRRHRRVSAAARRSRCRSPTRSRAR